MSKLPDRSMSAFHEPTASSAHLRHLSRNQRIDSNGSDGRGAMGDNASDIGSQNTNPFITTVEDTGFAGSMAAGGGDGDGWPSRTSVTSVSRRAMIQNRIIRYIGHFILVVFLSIIVILLLVAVGIPMSDNGVPPTRTYSNMEFNWKIDPKSYLSPMNSNFTNYNILLDAHIHTVYSDGVLTPKQVIEFALANGYNAIIVTDHQTVAGSLATKKYAEEHYKDQITIITGMEYTSCRIHMNFIGINESIPVSPPQPSDEQLKEVIQRVHDMGGLVIVNHIPWSNATMLPWDVPRLPNNPSREDLYDWGVDGFEVVNQNTFDLRTYQFIQEHSDRLVGLTGSDMHRPDSSYAWTTINAADNSAEAILDEIRNRRTSFLLDPSGTRPVNGPPYNPEYFKYAPWGLIGDYFYGYVDRYRGQYSFQASFCQSEVVIVHHRMIGWFFLWLFVSIIILEILYWLFRWLALLIWRKIRACWGTRRGR
ncbi:PHP domain-like protein [Linderina pennispora]|uniref:PHP domain-like protein n=1 Tax=Linderina pennispora TaxID=61395 RepID=A0A1Y1W358_9FUNG|nr:PHP domain-like protein [Linderina pennispora]ORX67594.1 PHP domain-like protein [Linderina pennispora]